MSATGLQEPQVIKPPVDRLPEPSSTQARIWTASIRLLVVLNLLLGTIYITWRYGYSINWAFWPLAIALIIAETYSYIDAWLFGITMGRLKIRDKPPPPPENATVDVFITCYNEPVELVQETARAAKAIRFPHNTYVLDDGNSPEMRAMAEAEGIGYVTRTADWSDRPRHAKAGNLNNALAQTTGEFLLILDADQIPFPEILDQTLGYFRDEKVSFVQTPQWFYNVPKGDPFGSQAPLFYGPIQQGKDGWNAAFFCGSNAVLRREALLSIGIRHYAKELERRVGTALREASKLLRRAEQQLRKEPSGSPIEQERALSALQALQLAIRHAQVDLDANQPIQLITWEFQRRARELATRLVAADLVQIRADLAGIPGIDAADIDASLHSLLDDEAALAQFTNRASSPLVAIEAARSLLLAVDVDRDDEAMPIMPMSTVSVTEDMASAMRLHASGWKSVYHHEILARGLAPEDLRTMLQQRLRWAQGTMQVMLRENPLVVRGLSLGQRLMYFATMWSYLSGFFTVIYLMSPVLYQFFGWLPVRAFSTDFFIRFIPYFIVNQILFMVVALGRKTWRGQQYSLALFPIWIQSVTSAVSNVWFARKLGFVVTPKTRQGQAPYRLIWPQLLAMALLAASMLYGGGRLLIGDPENQIAIVVNIVWALYSLLALSVVIVAIRYKAPEDSEAIDAEVATAQGRLGAAMR